MKKPRTRSKDLPNLMADSLALGGALMAARLGHASTRQALNLLANLLGAKRVALVTISGARRAQLIDSTALNFADSVEIRSDLDTHAPRLADPIAAGSYRLQQTRNAIIGFAALEKAGKDQTLLAFQWATPPDSALLAAICQQAAATWSGLLTLHPLPAPVDTTKNTPPPDPLGAENPFDLTRSEMRVCQLLKSGQRPVGIADALGISVTTIRTHLRHIYAKTDKSGMLELLHMLASTSGSAPKGKSRAA